MTTIAPTAANAIPFDRASLHPWRRYFARMLDIYLFFVVAGLLIGAAVQIVAPGQIDAYFARLISASDALERFEFFVWVNFVGFVGYVVYEAFCLAAFGTTLIRALLRIKVERIDGRRIDARAALMRSIQAYAIGLALGMPVLGSVAPLIAYIRLRRLGTTWWDERGGFVVRFGPVGIGRWLLYLGLVAAAYFVMCLGTSRFASLLVTVVDPTLLQPD